MTAVDRRFPSGKVLKVGDLIQTVGNVKTTSVCTLQRTLGGQRGGTVVPVTVQRGGKPVRLSVRTIGNGNGGALLGIGAQSIADVGKFPRTVKINAGSVGGPSAGLAFTLEVLDQAERDMEDPAQLELQFKLDHLATRERRNAENLIILGGGRPGRQWRNPVPLLDLVRSAVAETA